MANVCERAGNNARFLIRDLIPDIIQLHQQTVKVMHGYALACMITIIHHTKFCTKSLSVILQESRNNKSKDARCACVRYLHEIIASSTIATKDIEILCKTLAKALLDPSQQVRIEARLGFDSFRDKYPDLWHKLVVSEDTCVIKDPRLKKSLMTDLSSQIQQVPSIPTHDSFLFSVGEISSNNNINSISNPFEKPSILTPAPKIIKPPMVALEASNGDNRDIAYCGKLGNNSSGLILEEEKILLAPTGLATADRQDDEMAQLSVRRQTLSVTLKERLAQSVLVKNKGLRQSPSSPFPLISRKNFTSSSSPAVESNSDVYHDDATDIRNIASQILTAHKCFIDKEIETIELERNLLFDFEKLLAADKSIRDNSDEQLREVDDIVTENQLLEYFESVGVFLETHTLLNKALLDSMDQISRGEGGKKN